MTRKVHVAHNSGKTDWYTPDDWLELAREVLEEIDLDPASSALANRRVRAKRYYDVAADGLSPRKRWRGRVWMNPPYNRCAAFIDRLLAEFVAGNVTEAIVLVNNSTDSRWGQRLIAASSAVLFPAGRISFVDGQGGPSKMPLQGQMLCYLGDRPGMFSAVFGPKGLVVTRFPELVQQAHARARAFLKRDDKPSAAARPPRTDRRAQVPVSRTHSIHSHEQ
jgi:hypothetical protein